MQSWQERARWAATTLLLTWVVSFGIGMILSVTGLIDLDQSVAGGVVFALSIPCAILLRRHWQAIRAWSEDVDDRFGAHPVVAVGVYALMGLILSLGFGQSLGIMALGASSWALMGWFDDPPNPLPPGRLINLTTESLPPSDWSAVDTATEPRRLLSGLDALRAEPFFEESKARISALLAAAPSTSVLDVGCGTGEDAITFDGTAIGIENSRVMCEEARARHADLPLVVADAKALPIRDAAVDALRADRVIEHLHDAPAALRGWRRVLRPGGRVITFDPDFTTASVDGVDERSAATVLGWRVSTRPGATTVHTLHQTLEAAGFAEVRIEPRTLELTDLDRADGIMGLATWAYAAAEAGACSPTAAQLWNDDVRAAGRNRTLRYRCTYLLASATAR